MYRKGECGMGEVVVGDKKNHERAVLEKEEGLRRCVD